MKNASPKKKVVAANAEDANQSTSTKEADERRLRKLKGFLKSVSYNGSEGMQFETLNDLYSDTLLLDRPPCTEILTLGEFKCNPTPFLVSSCFNRTQVDKTKGKIQRGLKKTIKKTTPNRTRKVPTPKKNTATLSETYGRMEGKIKLPKIPSIKQETSRGKVGFEVSTKGRRSALDVAVETAVQSGNTQTPMKDVEKKEDKKTSPERSSENQETTEKTSEKESAAKEKEDEDKTMPHTEEKRAGHTEGAFVTKKESDSDKLRQEDSIKNEEKQENGKEKDQKVNDTINNSVEAEKSNEDDIKPGKSTKEVSKNTTTNKSLTGKTSLKQAQNSANTASKTKIQEYVYSRKVNEKTNAKFKNSSSKKEVSHMKTTKSSTATSLMRVASTSKESRTPSTRLRKLKSKTSDDEKKDSRLTRLRRERLSCYNNASPDKNDRDHGNRQYSVRKRQVKKTHTR